MSSDNHQKNKTEYSSSSSIETYLNDPIYGIEAIEIFIDAYKKMEEVHNTLNVYSAEEQPQLENTIKLTNILELTRTLPEVIKPAVQQYLECFKAYTERNVLEQNISIVISKNGFVSGIMKAFKNRSFAHEFDFDFDLREMITTIKAEKASDKNNLSNFRSYLKSKPSTMSQDQPNINTNPVENFTFEHQSESDERPYKSIKCSKIKDIVSPERGTMNYEKRVTTSPNFMIPTAGMVAQSLDFSQIKMGSSSSKSIFLYKHTGTSHSKLHTTKKGYMNIGRSTMPVKKHNDLRTSSKGISNYLSNTSANLMTARVSPAYRGKFIIKDKVKSGNLKLGSQSKKYLTKDCGVLHHTSKHKARSNLQSTKKSSKKAIKLTYNNYMKYKSKRNDHLDSGKESGDAYQKCNPEIDITDLDKEGNTFENRKRSHVIKDDNTIETPLKTDNNSKLSMHKLDSSNFKMTPTSSLTASKFQSKLLEANSLSHLMNSSGKFRPETSEERANKKDCTFHPNLKSTKKMNLLLSSRGAPDSNGISKPIKTINLNEDLDLSFKSFGSGSSSKPNQSQSSKNFVPKSTLGHVNNTVVLQVNLVSNTGSLSKLNTYLKNGYSQRSLERKQYTNTAETAPRFRVAAPGSNTNSLAQSKSHLALGRLSTPSHGNLKQLCSHYNSAEKDKSRTKMAKESRTNISLAIENIQKKVKVDMRSYFSTGSKK